MSIEDMLQTVEPKLNRIESEMSQPEIATNPRLMADLSREHHRLTELITTRDQLINVRAEISSHQELMNDPELADLVADEIPILEQKATKLEKQLHALLIPAAEEDNRNAVLEIRAGTGGDEAALFAADLFSMYKYYIEKKGWKYKLLSANYIGIGGIKELILSVSGNGAYGRLKLESGVHRVQRVPTTETSGRVHTSAATVAVLPEAEEIDIQIEQSDLRIDTFRSSGPGGQHVNKTESAIRITHLPTGTVVSCQDEKSQMKNKAQAMRVLRARLFKLAIDEEQNKRASERRLQVSSGDRSAKIRTYNYSQSRITDHRVPISIFKFDEVLTGNLDLLLDPLNEYFTNEHLKQIVEESTQ